MSLLTFTSSPGDGVGQGQVRRIEPQQNIQFGGDLWDDNNYLSLLVRSADATGDWSLLMGAPRGQRLVPGVYTGAKRLPAIGSAEPRLSLSGEGRSCNASTGQFEVLEAIFGPPQGGGASGTIERFHARFTQQCDGAPAGLTGEVLLVSLPRVCRITGGC